MLTNFCSETQLRSRLKKWGVTKPSRQRRKKPFERLGGDGFNQHLKRQECRMGDGYAHETMIPSLHDHDIVEGPSIWDDHRPWISSSPNQLQVPSFVLDEHRPIQALMTPSYNASFACLSDDTVDYMEKQPMALTLDLPNDEPRPSHHVPGVYKSTMGDRYGNPLRSELASPVEASAYNFLSNVLSAGCGSPDSGRFQVENQHQTPPHLSSPITQPTTPWGCPTPNTCHDISFSAYHKDSSAMMHVGHMVKVASNDSNHLHNSGRNSPLEDRERSE